MNALDFAARIPFTDVNNIKLAEIYRRTGRKGRKKYGAKCNQKPICEFTRFA